MMVRIHPHPDSSFGLDPDHDSPKSELTRCDKFQCCVVGQCGTVPTNIDLPPCHERKPNTPTLPVSNMTTQLFSRTSKGSAHISITNIPGK
jgi:hypothetical protein